MQEEEKKKREASRKVSVLSKTKVAAEGLLKESKIKP